MEENLIVEEIECEEIFVLDKKVMKKDIKRVGWGLIWYTLINLLVVTIVIAAQTIIFEMSNAEGISLEEFMVNLENEGTSMIIGVLVGILFLRFFMRKNVQKEMIFSENRKMTFRKFWQLLCIFMTAQFVFSLFASFMEAVLNVIGYSAMESIEAATGGSQTISMFFYASFVAPIVEELVYRGLIFRALRKYGKMFAIVTSSILFGIMHANLPQMAFAMAVGFVLAYVTEEYSIKWAILLHMINNFVFAELISLFGKVLGTEIGEALNGLVIFGFFIAGCIVLWKNRTKVVAYFTENKEESRKYVYAFTTVSVLLFVIFNLLVGISMIQPLSV